MKKVVKYYEFMTTLKMDHDKSFFLPKVSHKSYVKIDNTMKPKVQKQHYEQPVLLIYLTIDFIANNN